MTAPTHLGNVDQSFDAFFKFYKHAIVSDADDSTLDLGSDRVFGININPRIGTGLFETQ